MTGKVAEVIKASSTAFTAQCYQLYEAPPLGAFVRAGEDSPVYGVVCNVATGPLDEGRHVLPRGEGAENEQEVYEQNPQLEHLLATTFQVLLVGYESANGPVQGLPPLPPRVHAFVWPCSATEVARFARGFSFLRLLLRAKLEASDEVVAACLRSLIAAQRPRDGGGSTGEAVALEAGRALARELASDTARLSALLKTITP